MAETNGLLNRRTGLTGIGGSNPPLSAVKQKRPADRRGFCFHKEPELAQRFPDENKNYERGAIP